MITRWTTHLLIVGACGALALGAADAAYATAEDPKTILFDGPRVIFDGTNNGWIQNTTGEPIPSEAVDERGINPHAAGCYITLYEKPVQNFILEFDYMLTPGCNSGVFLRVGDPRDPVMTGLEVALDDTTGTGYHDPGAIYDLARPSANTQKPAGQWNHMRIEAVGPLVTVTLNGEQINQIDMSEFKEPGKRPDGSNHKFRDVAIRDLIQEGYLGFQDHGSDCWFKNIKLMVLDE